MDREGIPDLWTLIKDCEFFQICSAVMCAIVIGCSGAIAMSLIIHKKQVEKQRRQQVVVIAVHEFSHLRLANAKKFQARNVCLACMRRTRNG